MAVKIEISVHSPVTVENTSPTFLTRTLLPHLLCTKGTLIRSKFPDSPLYNRISDLITFAIWKVFTAAIELIRCPEAWSSCRCTGVVCFWSWPVEIKWWINLKFNGFFVNSQRFSDLQIYQIYILLFNAKNVFLGGIATGEGNRVPQENLLMMAKYHDEIVNQNDLFIYLCGWCFRPH